jgi:hypothetical protein
VVFTPREKLQWPFFVDENPYNFFLFHEAKKAACEFLQRKCKITSNLCLIISLFIF